MGDRQRKPKPRQAPSREVVRAFSRHLHYETLMFINTAMWLGQLKVEPPEVGNAILESFTIHTRGLSQFFFPLSGQRRDNDVLVWDYIDRATWEARTGGDLPPGLVKINDRVGTEIAHLSYHRVAKTLPNEWQWDVSAILRAMLPLIERLTSEAPKELLGPEWATAKTARAVVEVREPQAADVFRADTTTTVTTTTVPTMANSIAFNPTVGSS